ncbi:MAG: hypothetical protein H6Q90_5201 [Deltaproteobacteria bacterium]|nr:hypothetical protein [Deltaproteobacteria bacterium]
MWRKHVGGAIGLVLGALIGVWCHGPNPDQVLNAMAMVCGGLGWATGLVAQRAGTRPKALLSIVVGLVACLFVGLLMLLYRWLAH